MCNPVLALTIASTAVAGMGQLQAGAYASRMARYQASVAETNKQRVREGINDTIAQGQEQQRQLGRETAAMIGAQTARMGANNVDVGFGSAARAIGDTAMIGAEDSAALSDNVSRSVRAMASDVWNYESEKRARIAEGKQAKTASYFAAATTALGGATQYAKFKSSLSGGA